MGWPWLVQLQPRKQQGRGVYRREPEQPRRVCACSLLSPQSLPGIMALSSKISHLPHRGRNEDNNQISKEAFVFEFMAALKHLYSLLGSKSRQIYVTESTTWLTLPYFLLCLFLTTHICNSNEQIFLWGCFHIYYLCFSSEQWLMGSEQRGYKLLQGILK